ncbi:hypothetical protein D3C72_564270 [compost metagenome]
MVEVIKVPVFNVTPVEIRLVNAASLYQLNEGFATPGAEAVIVVLWPMQIS